MNRESFIKQFEQLGFKLSIPREGFVAFSFTIPVGKFAGREVTLAFHITPDAPIQPPTGPHVSPRLLAIHPGNDLQHPAGGVHESPSLGPDWQYWSRPFQGWAKTDRSAKAYMAFINRLFETQ